MFIMIRVDILAQGLRFDSFSLASLYITSYANQLTITYYQRSGDL